jgi:hypothetical protein
MGSPLDQLRSNIRSRSSGQSSPIAAQNLLLAIQFSFFGRVEANTF